MPFPPVVLSIHNAPQPGETFADVFPDGLLPRHRAVGQSRRSASLNALAKLWRATLTPEQEAADAREQQAIADAVEGVIP